MSKPWDEALVVLSTDPLDTSSLDGCLGGITHRVAGKAFAEFLKTTGSLGLNGPIDFSVLNLIAHNPGVTSRQICHALNILPPNLAIRIKGCEERGLIEKRPHAVDHRALALHLTHAGLALNGRAEKALTAGDDDLLWVLAPVERKTLMRLLRKLY